MKIKTMSLARKKQKSSFKSQNRRSGSTLTSLFVSLALLSLAGCKKTDSNSQTFLGSRGNEDVVRRFMTYQKNAGCKRPPSPHPRILLTGFGPFQGTKVNFSGALVDYISQPQLWPGVAALDSKLRHHTEEHLPPLGLPGPWEARAQQRTLTFNGKQYEVCFLIASVEWDYAAAVMIRELKNFEPDLILMTGLNAKTPFQATLEVAARNKANDMEGFDSSGALDENNRPLKSYVLPKLDDGVKETIQMTWDTKKLLPSLLKAKQNLAMLPGEDPLLQFSFVAADDANTISTYICNNVSFVVLHALKGAKVRLAGERLVFDGTTRLAQTKAGFLHLPANAQTTSASFISWGKMIFTLIENHFEVH